ncbi:MAG: site-specific DNA-methyltransferase [Rothia sp. (in: high G+C Gram-positive bacteria)]|uniref:DNA-methyltransferase n=1 Tax=Rothia sp. (in: high G+C Gram-positive bacteria) TaxID=1885016 RepID=UPI0026DFFCB6|nr:site-specific DNA-methyltransferase [Rothia sp. (in: high G+C Gram-positive bacteria)]MDO5751059.1 site-specific DNA-methyltransferase [Rothia sp. (in: high G+C Gram-positive bacteria)]
MSASHLSPTHHADAQATAKAARAHARSASPAPAATDPVFDPAGPSLLVQADNLEYLRTLPDASFTVIYIDPPFNTGKPQTRRSYSARSADAQGDSKGSGGQDSAQRTGFKGKSYSTVLQTIASYSDSFEDYWAFLEPRIREAHRLLAEDGTLYLHLDWREVHYAKIMCDMIFGRDCFLNELIWAYDYGAKSTRRWPTKHDNILVYVKNSRSYYFNTAEVDREPYMAPSLVTEEKAARGKLPTDVWWHTIVSPTGKEKTGYPTQKPVGLLRRMIAASSRPGDWVLDFFAGSGTTGAAAASLGRKFVCVDQNPSAIETMAHRLNASETSLQAYRGVPRGASVLFTPHRSVGVRGGTSRDALMAASRKALAAQRVKLQQQVQPVEGAACEFVRHSSTDAVEKQLRVQAREHLRRERRRQELAKKRAAS